MVVGREVRRAHGEVVDLTALRLELETLRVERGKHLRAEPIETMRTFHGNRLIPCANTAVPARSQCKRQQCSTPALPMDETTAILGATSASCGRTPPSHQRHNSIHDELRWSFAEMVGIPRYGRGKSQVNSSLRRAIAGRSAIDHRNSKRTFLREIAEYINLYKYIIIFIVLYLHPISLSWSRSRQSLPANRASTLSGTQRKTPSKPTTHRSPRARAASQHRRACASHRAARA